MSLLIKKWLPHVAGPAVIFIGIFIGFYEDGINDRLLTTEGTILESEIYTRPSGTRTGFHINVHYTYLVKGKLYESRNIGMAKFYYSDEKEAEKAIAPYKKGSQVKVYYDNNNPDRGYLDISGYGNSIYIIVIGILIGLIITPVTIIVRRKNTK